MAIQISDKKEPIVIDLNGPQGNAYVLLSSAEKLAKNLGLNADSILDEMKEDGYEHLVRTFEKHFGSYITLKMSEELKEEIFN